MTTTAVYGAGMTGMYIARELAGRTNKDNGSNDKIILIGRSKDTEILSNNLISDMTDTITYLQKPNLDYFDRSFDRIVYATDDDIGKAKTIDELAGQIRNEFNALILEMPVDWKKRFVLLSSDSVYGSQENHKFKEDEDAPNCLNAYDYAKADQEKLLAQTISNADYVILRVATIYGAGFTNNLVHELCVKALSGETITVQPGKRDYIHITDFLFALVSAVEMDKAGRQIINLGGDHPQDNVILARAINALANSSPYMQPRAEVISSGKKDADSKFIEMDLEKMRKVLKHPGSRVFHRGIQTELIRIVKEMNLDYHTKEELKQSIGWQALDIP